MNVAVTYHVYFRNKNKVVYFFSSSERKYTTFDLKKN